MYGGLWNPIVCSTLLVYKLHDNRDSVLNHPVPASNQNSCASASARGLTLLFNAICPNRDPNPLYGAMP